MSSNWKKCTILQYYNFSLIWITLTVVILKKILLGAWLRSPLPFKAILGNLMTSFSPYEDTSRGTEALIITQLGILFKESWGRNLKKKKKRKGVYQRGRVLSNRKCRCSFDITQCITEELKVNLNKYIFSFLNCESMITHLQETWKIKSNYI